MTREEAIVIYRQGEEAVVSKFMEFDERLKRLEEKLNMNSSNSSKPPSTDNKLSKRKKGSQKPSNKKRGGQLGREGKSLKMVKRPDRVVKLKPERCKCCHKDISEIESKKVIKRQLFDTPPVTIEVTEYQRHTVCCPYCKTDNRAEFPKELKAPTAYGNNLKSLISYLNTYQMLPYERISEFIEDIFKHKISTGSIYNFLQEGFDKLEAFEISVKDRLLQQEVIHVDETGVNVSGELKWIHITTTDKIALYAVHNKRGKEAINDIGIFPHYQGIAVHDHWSTYISYKSMEHSFCNAHILRELQSEIDTNGYQWAKDMQKMLKDANKQVKESKKKHCNALLKPQIEKYFNRYNKITQGALRYYPPPIKSNKKGKVKQPKGKNLLDRLIGYKNETLRFIYDFRVPFTNNLAERDLRMIKVKQKISGTFASFNGAAFFCRLRSYIVTIRKNGLSVMDALRMCYKGEALRVLGW